MIILLDIRLVATLREQGACNRGPLLSMMIPAAAHIVVAECW
jgi:hypothetical protein